MTTQTDRRYKPEAVVTDEADGANAFANWLKVVGKFAGWYVRPNNTAGDDGKLNCRLVVIIDEITEAVRVDGTTPDFSELEISWPYSQWDTDEGVALTPTKRTTWFRAVVPAWMEAGLDPTVENLNVLEEAHAPITLENQIRELGYDRRVYENDEVVMVDGEELKEAATYEDCLPTAIQAANADPEAPGKRAAELWEEHGGDMAAFKTDAAKDATIKRDPKLRRAIQSGKYEEYAAA